MDDLDGASSPLGSFLILGIRPILSSGAGVVGVPTAAPSEETDVPSLTFLASGSSGSVLSLGSLGGLESSWCSC